MLCALDETAREEFPRHVLLAGIDANTHSSIAGGPARNLQQVPRHDTRAFIAALQLPLSPTLLRRALARGEVATHPILLPRGRAPPLLNSESENLGQGVADFFRFIRSRGLVCSWCVLRPPLAPCSLARTCGDARSRRYALANPFVATTCNSRTYLQVRGRCPISPPLPVIGVTESLAKLG